MGCCVNKYRIKAALNDEPCKNKKKFKIANFKHVIKKSRAKIFRVKTKANPQKTRETELNEWRNLIEKLISNQSLIKYATDRVRTDFVQVKELIEYLSKCSHALNDLEKAWLVYVWIAHNIDYDLESYLENIYYECNNEWVLKSGLAMCKGYTSLFKTLCSHLGVKCYELIGSTKGFTYKVGSNSNKENYHSWNIIICNDGHVYHVETTWGAGHVDNKKYVKEFKPCYFGVPTCIFNETHYYDSSVSPILEKNRIFFDKNIYDNSANNKLEFHMFGLRCVEDSTMPMTNANIEISTNQLIIEYESNQNLCFTHELVDGKTGEEVKNALLVQTQFPEKIENLGFFKYCLIGDIPHIHRKYLVRLFAKLRSTSNIEKEKCKLITEFSVIRHDSIQARTENQIPYYNLWFDHSIQLMSHKTQHISFPKNPLVMKFLVSNHIKFDLDLKDPKTNVSIANSVLVHKDPEANETVCYIALEEKNERFILNVYANDDLTSKTLKSIAEFHLIRTDSNENDNLKFCSMYGIGRRCGFVYSPRENQLYRGETYFFKYFVRDALDVVLVDGQNKWISLRKQFRNDADHVWLSEVKLTVKGRLQVFARFHRDTDYVGICLYEVLEKIDT